MRSSHRVKPTDSKKFKEALNRFIEKEDIGTDFSRGCQERAISYDWERQSEITKSE